MASVWSLFAVLTLFKSGSTLLLHEAGKHAENSSAITVLLGEVCKLVISFLLLYQEHDRVDSVDEEGLLSEGEFFSEGKTWLVKDAPSLLQTASFTIRHVVQDLSSTQAWKLGLVASLYVVQNNLFLWAASRLDPSFFQALWQLRIFMTAIFSRILLQAVITRRQWICLGFIFVGVLLVQQGTSMEADAYYSATTIKKLLLTSSLTAHPSSLTLAMAALAGAGVLSGLAGVILEQVLVKTDTNLWCANILLSSFSIIPATLIVLCKLVQSPSDTLLSFKMLSTSMWPWSATLCHGTAGILCALITKKAGTIANNLTTALSIIVTFGFSSFVQVLDRTSTLPIVLIALGSGLILRGSYVFQKQVSLRKEEDAQGYIAISTCASSPRILAQTEAAFLSIPQPVQRFSPDTKEA